MTQFDFDTPPASPLAWMEAWFAEGDALDVPNPNAMYLATVDADGTPSVRTVLRRGFDEQGGFIQLRVTQIVGHAGFGSCIGVVPLGSDRSPNPDRRKVSKVEPEVSDAYCCGTRKVSAWPVNRASLCRAEPSLRKR